MAGKLLITPNSGATVAGNDPTIKFQGTGNTSDITLRTTTDGTLSFEGTTGQLFSISDSMSGTVFSANDISGIPSIEVLDTGLVKLAQYSGNVVLGTATDNTVDKLQVNGSVIATKFTGSLVGNASTATSADQIDGVGFRNTGENASVDANTQDSNGITYSGINFPTFVGGTNDGGLYSQIYSPAWQHQIAGCYRTGQLQIRGKSNGTWQAWRTALDSTNYTTYAPTLTGVGASGTWGISVTGNATAATTSGNLYGAGGNYIASTTSGLGYDAAIQIREAGLGGANANNMAFAPRLGFHWAGMVASTIAIEPSGRIAVFNNPGTSYENFIANNITGNTFASTVATGTAPFTVVSATPVTNLNIGGNAGSATTLSAGTDRTKLDGIATGANNYAHPANHAPSIITQDASNRFVTDAEKSTWNGKQAAGSYATGTGSASGVNTGDQTNISGNAATTSMLQGSSLITYGASGTQWLNQNGVGGAGTNGTAPSNPTNDWYHHLIFNHANTTGFYVDFATCFHSDTFAIKRVAGGVDYGWRTLWHSGNLTNLSQLTNGPGFATGGGTASGTNTGDQTSVTGNAGSATTLSVGTDRTKLDGIAANANNYAHPTNHPPSIITQDASNRFVTDAEKASWNGKQSAGSYAVLADITGNTRAGSFTSLTSSGVATFGSAKLNAGWVAGTMGYSDSSWGFLFRPPVVGTQAAYAFQSSGGSQLFTITESGDATAIGNVIAYSDERLKTNWQGVPEDFLNRLAGVKVGTYDRIDTGARQAGVSAQSLQEILPEAVVTGVDGMLAVAYGNAALVAVIEMAKELVELKKRLAALEA